MIAVIFPGQGAQAPGMGLELARAYPASAGAVFATADRVLGFRLSRLIATGDQRLLSRTDITQPALLAASLAAWQALRAELPRLRPSCAAGLSLGEYTALVAAGTIDMTSAFRLISWRGRYMDDAAAEQAGGMCAILGLKPDDVEELCQKTRAGGAGDVWVANLNAPGQTVISGRTPAVEEAATRAAALGGRVVPLKVSGAFHSPLMAGASRRLSPLLGAAPWRTPTFPVYSNVTGRPYEGAAGIAEGLAAQVTSPVLWEEVVLDMARRGVRVFLELGPGKTLASLVARILPEATVLGVSDPASLARTAEALGDYALEVVS
jgi:[acyl-carrier-protein] S-malonyltransferase